MATVVIQPAVDAMRRRGTPYQGLLYAGLCPHRQGVRVVEFNARFGDPETQVVLDRLGTPLGGLLHAAATGGLAGLAPPPRWRAGRRGDGRHRGRGLPGRSGDRGCHQRPGAIRTACRGAYVLQAGTSATGRDGVLRSSGGRVLNVVGTGPEYRGRPRPLPTKRRGKIQLRGGWWRVDIAARRGAGAERRGRRPGG